MKPFKHPWTNLELGKPRDWDEKRFGPCESLPVVKGDGIFFSYWKPTWRERVRLAFGANVRLCISGSSHPPVMLDIDAP
jgi:hypothetical protein